MSRKSLAEGIGLAAVVLSLVFVGLEIRQNTRSTQVSAYQDLIEKVTLLATRAGDDPEFGGLLFGDAGTTLPESLEDLSPGARTKFDEFMWLVVRHGDMAYYQYERGLLSRDRLASATTSLRSHVVRPLAQAWWEEERSNFVQEYQDRVDGIIADVVGESTP